MEKGLLPTDLILRHNAEFRRSEPQARDRLKRLVSDFI